MISESVGAAQRSIASKTLTKILLLGLFSSTLLHIVAIAGVSYWAGNRADEQMEIVEIERVEVEPATAPANVTKPLAQPLKTAIAPIKTPAPKVVKPTIASLPRPIPTPVVKITKSAVVAQPLTSPLSTFVSPTANRVPQPVKIAAGGSPKSNLAPAFPSNLFAAQQPKSAKIKPATRKIEPNSPPSLPAKKSQPITAINPPVLAPIIEPKQVVPHPPTDLPDTSLRSQDWSNSSTKTTDRSNLDRQPNLLPGVDPSLDDIDPNTLDRTPENNTRITPNSQITTPPTTNQIGLGSNPTQGGGSGNGNSNGSAKSSGGNPEKIMNGNGNSNDDTPEKVVTESKDRSSIQCLQNCEIRYPDELENSDIGKDKILVKVTIDPSGAVTNAEIERSSGNDRLDLFTISGVKQMQFNATGKTRTPRIKVSTSTR